MKTYKELTKSEQEKAVMSCTDSLLRSIIEGAIRFGQDDLQSRIDLAQEKAEAMQTPWFAGEYIMEHCGNDIEDMARCTAEDALFSEPDENVISGIVGFDT